MVGKKWYPYKVQLNSCIISANNKEHHSVECNFYQQSDEMFISLHRSIQIASICMEVKLDVGCKIVGCAEMEAGYQITSVSVMNQWECWESANKFCLFIFIVYFTSYFVFSITVLPNSPRLVYYHLLLRRETRIPRVAPFSFRIGIWNLFVHRGQTSYRYTHSLWEVVDHSRSKMHETCLIIIHDPGRRPGPESNRGLADKCSTTELTLLLLFTQ